MYATPKVYEDLVVAEPKISMYKVAPVYTDISLPDKEDGVWAQDLQARQDKCLSELELLQQRLGKIEVCADLETLHILQTLFRATSSNLLFFIDNKYEHYYRQIAVE